jgi:hypothetical protein
MLGAPQADHRTCSHSCTRSCGGHRQLDAAGHVMAMLTWCFPQRVCGSGNHLIGNAGDIYTCTAGETSRHALTRASAPVGPVGLSAIDRWPSVNAFLLGSPAAEASIITICFSAGGSVAVPRRALQELSRKPPYIATPNCCLAQLAATSCLRSNYIQLVTFISNSKAVQPPSRCPPRKPVIALHSIHKATTNMGSINAYLLAFLVAAAAAVQLAAADWGEGRGESPTTSQRQS